MRKGILKVASRGSEGKTPMLPSSYELPGITVSVRVAGREVLSLVTLSHCWLELKVNVEWIVGSGLDNETWAVFEVMVTLDGVAITSGEYRYTTTLPAEMFAPCGV
jgi:hypothetical protein